MTLSSFLSAFLPVVHGDAPVEVPITAEESQPVKEEAEPEKEDEKQDEQADSQPAEEEEEPEDVGRFLFLCIFDVTDCVRQIHPQIREGCKQSAKCANLSKHFEHCQEKVHAGKGFKGEDCVEELYVRFFVALTLFSLAA